MSSSQPARRGVVAVIVQDGKFLVIRRSQTVAAPGAYCFPGGGIEPGETEECALIRELQEELGLIARPAARVWQSVTSWGVELAWWTAAIDPAALFAPAAAEVESVHWLLPDEIARLPRLLSSNRDFFTALAGGKIVLT